MKKFLLLLSALLLFCLPALAQSPEIPDTLYAIVLRTEAGDVPLGTGVLFGTRDVLLTASACVKDGELYAVNASGETRITKTLTVSDTGLAMLQLSTPASVQPIAPTEYDQYGKPYIFGAEADGVLTAVPLKDMKFGYYRNLDAMALVAEASDLKPGAIVLDSANRLLGVTVSRHGEGEAIYTALEAGSFYDLTWEGVSAANQTFLPISGVYEDGYLHLTWEDPANRRQGIYCLYASAVDNQYYTYYTAEPTERSIDIILPPGHAYDIQVQWALNVQTARDIDLLYTTRFREEAAPFTDLGITAESYVAIDPVDRVIPGIHERDDFFSVDILADSKRTSGYQVILKFEAPEETELPMVTELIAPDGQFFYQEGSYRLNPEMTNDHFCIDLTQMWMDCATFSDGTIPSGDYTLRCHFGGKQVCEYVFHVEPTGTPEPEAPAAKAGIVRNLRVTQEAGQVFVDWSDSADLPEGEYDLYLFRICEGNIHYTSRKLQETDKEARQTFFFPVPGKGTNAWLVWVREGGDAYSVYPSGEQEFVNVPAQTKVLPYRRNGFICVRSGLTGAESSDVYQPTEPLTRAWIESGETIAFQVEDRYQVSENSEQHPMVIVLHTPEGFSFIRDGYFGFMPELCEGDIWAVDITRLFRDYESLLGKDAYPAGEYRIVRYIDGCEANRLTFTLEEK